MLVLLSALTGIFLGLLTGTTKAASQWFVYFMPPTYPTSSNAVLTNGWHNTPSALDWGDASSPTHEAFLRAIGSTDEDPGGIVLQARAVVYSETWANCANSIRIDVKDLSGTLLGTHRLVHTIKNSMTTHDLHFAFLQGKVNSYSVGSVLQDYENDTCTNTGPHIHEFADTAVSGAGSWKRNTVGYPNYDPCPAGTGCPTRQNNVLSSWTNNLTFVR